MTQVEPLTTSPSEDNSTTQNDDVISSAVVGDICRVFGVFFAIFVRVLLVVFSLFTVWLVVAKVGSNLYWLLVLPITLIVVEGIYTVIKRGGQERKWVCWCFLLYLVSVVPPIWLLELDRLDEFNDKYDAAVGGVSIVVSGVSADIHLDSSAVLSVTEQCLVFLLILCRWLLPRGDITRDQLSQLLFVFIGMASDVMELFQLFDEEEVRQDKTLTYVILAVWTFSLFQFSLVLTMSQSPKKPRAIGGVPESRPGDPGKDGNNDNDDRRKTDDDGESRANLCSVLIHTEIWSLIVTISMQDGPFLCVRLYTLLQHDLITYSIIFFTCKNVLVILLLLYRLIVVILKRMEEKNDEENSKVDTAEFGERQDGILRQETIIHNDTAITVESNASGNMAIAESTNLRQDPVLLNTPSDSVEGPDHQRASSWNPKDSRILIHVGGGGRHGSLRKEAPQDQRRRQPSKTRFDQDDMKVW
ncbi:transmembrane protein 26 [Aplysia californica]|uniref:Transmembrane protein 26 n=1 Tax=Aplysia californica TaxID=6500 RepID=A0ABM1A9X1_APLCA|nr:transmembrane protein 26 [Aplysia californica]